MFCHVQFFTLNVHINICFCMGFHHAHLCTNNYPYSCTSLYEWLSILFFYVFSSCTSLCEWLSIFLWVFVMHIFVRMTIHFLAYGFSSCTFMYEWQSIFFLNVFSSCTFLYKWLSISFWMCSCHAHFCTNDYLFLLERVFVMHIFLRRTIHILFVWVFVMYIFVQMTFHFFLNGFSSYKFLYEWLSISFLMGFRHAHFCKNDYPFLFEWVSSCTFLYELLPFLF